MSLGLFDVIEPYLVIFDRIDAQADYFAIAFFELGFQASQVTKLGCTDRREVLRV